MKITSFKTHRITSGESIKKLFERYLPPLEEKDIIVIASKMVSLCEKNVVILNSKISKTDIINSEADHVFNNTNNENFYLTLKNGRLIPNAGVDESNIAKGLIMLPKNPQLSAKKIWQYLKQRHNITKMGILITDSNVSPLRKGVIGIGIGWCGFKPLHNYCGKADVFGRKLQVTTINVLDSLASAATFVMGEGNEQTPLAIIKDAAKIIFQKRAPTAKEIQSTMITLDKDLFSPLIKGI